MKCQIIDAVDKSKNSDISVKIAEEKKPIRK